MKLNRTASALIAGSAALTLVLAGCSSDDNTVAEATESATSAATEASSAMEESDAAVQLTDAYIKEKPADKKMTGIFGVLSNTTDKDIKISSFKIEGLKEGTKFEQHDTKDGKMFEVPEGLTIPANGELALQPGSTHLMVMNNDEAMEQGAQYKLVIELSDGSSITQDIEVRVQPAGEEDYGEDGELKNSEHMGGDKMDHENMDHGSMEHEGH
ncbi:copper chaperone PCu(A)C [uncultured Corynebacterium sp.]|uniref:copper chaperone PCu(A)C n=1 Tax=uncultured Corynebacterium sp. TaxID=159447 RepID=UPI00260D4940|nr:copper chaperone PCu(A)C [uncultured Corynebacterium sp.]